MKILLVSSPLAHPMFPPSGIAYIKGFLKTALPTDEINCLDLNLKYYYKFLSKKNVETLNGILTANKEGHDLNTRIDKIEKVINSFDQAQEDNIKLLSKYLKNEINYDSIEYLLKDSYDSIDKYKSNLLGFSILFKTQLVYSLALAKLFKERNKNIKIVFGGALFQTSSSFECSDLVRDNYPIDYIIKDRGKTTFANLIKSIKDKTKDLSKLPNLIYYDKNERKIKRGKSSFRTYIEDFKKHSFPDYSDFQLLKYLSPSVSLPVELLLGCSWANCKFCQVKNTNRVLVKKIDNFIEEIIFLKKQYKIVNFRIIAAEVPSSILKILAKKLIESEVIISYSVYARPVKQINSSLLENMKLSGCRTINYGLESFSQKILDKMNKGTKIADIIDVLKKTKKAGINTFCWYMIGFPGHTTEDVKKEFNYLKKYKDLIDYFSCHPFHLVNKSIIHLEQKKIIESKIKKSLFFEFEDRKFFNDHLNFQIKKGISVDEAREWAKKFQSYFDKYINKKSNKNSSSIMIKYFYR